MTDNMDPAEQRKKFMKLCKAATDNDTAVLQLIEKRFSKADTNFLASQECALALQHAAHEIKADRNNKFVYIKKFMSLLKANAGKKRKNNDREHESDSSEPTAKRLKKVGNIEYSDGSESGPGGSEKHKSKEKEKKKSITQGESDSDTEPLVIAADDIKQFPKSDEKAKSKENAKKKADRESDTEPLSLGNVETKDSLKSGRKSNSVSPTAKQVKDQNPTKDCSGDQQLTILPLTPVKKSSPEKTDPGIPASYVSPTARYKYCHVAELRLTDDKSSTSSVKISNDNIITHIPRRKVARIVLNPLTPEKLPNGKTAVIIPKDSRRTAEDSVQGDRSPGAAVKSPGPEYVYVNLDSSQELVCEKGKKAVDDADSDVLSEDASIPDDKDANDQPDEDEQEDEVPEEKPEQEEDDEEDGPAPVKGSKKQLKKLEVLLEKISREIRKLESRELTLDELQDDNSAYAMEDRYKKKFCKVWDKYCEVAGRPPTTGRPTERRFRFEGTRYPEVNKKIERFVNKKHIFPDYHDIRDIVGKCNKKFQLRLKSSAADNLAREAFTVVGNELQKRRMLDFSDDFESRLDEPLSTIHCPHATNWRQAMTSSPVYSATPLVLPRRTTINLHTYKPYSDPALYDRGLRDKLDKNKKTFKSRMSDVLEKYARKQDDGDDGEDSEEEEENEEEAQTEGDAESDIENMFILPITSPAKIKAAAEAEQKPSTSLGPEDGVSPTASVKKPAETHSPTEQDSFMSAFGLQVRSRQVESPPKADIKENLKEKFNNPPQVSRCVIMETREEKSTLKVSSSVDIGKKREQSIPKHSTDVETDTKDSQSIPQVSEDVDVNSKVEKILPQVYMDVDIDEKDEESIPRVVIDLVEEDEESIPQTHEEVDPAEKDTKSTKQTCKDSDVNVEEKKSAPQVYKEVDIDDDLEYDHKLDDDEGNERQVYKEVDIDEEMEVDYESEEDEENQRQVYKELDIDEDAGVDDELDDDEENKRQVYKELDIDEMSDGNISHPSSPVKCLETDRPDSVESKKREPEVAESSQDLFEDSGDNDVHYQKMEDSQSPKIIPYEEKSPNGTKYGSISSTKALTYIDVADEDSCNVSINGVITKANVVEVIASDVIQLSDDLTSKSSVSRMESIESLGSVDNHRTKKSCDIKESSKGTEQGNDSEHIYMERGTLSQPINIEGSQQSDNDTNKAETQRDSVKTLNHTVNASHIEKENRDKVSDYRRNRLKLQKHKMSSTRVDSQTVESSVIEKNKTPGNAFMLGTVTVVDCSSEEDEITTKTKAPHPDCSVTVSSSNKRTDLTTHNNSSSNVSGVTYSNDAVKQKSSSVTYTNVTKGLEQSSPVKKNVAVVENRNFVDKSETLKKSPTPDRKVKDPEKGSPMAPIDVDKNTEMPQNRSKVPEKGSPMAPIDVDKNTETPQNRLKVLEKGSPTAPINVDKNTETPQNRSKVPEKGSPMAPIDVDKNTETPQNRLKGLEKGSPTAPINVDKNAQRPDCRVKAPEKGSPAKPIDVDENGQDDRAHFARVRGSINQPINVGSASSKGNGDVRLSVGSSNNFKTTTPPRNHHHSPVNNTIRSSPEAAAVKSSPQSTERRKVYTEAERREMNKSSQQKEPQRRVEVSPNSSKSNNSSDIIEIDDDSLVGSPEKTSNVGPAARGQRPSSNAPVTAPNVQKPASQPPAQAPNIARHPPKPHVPTPNVPRPASQPQALAPNVTRPQSQPPTSRPPSQSLAPALKVTKPLPKPLMPALNVSRSIAQPPAPAPKVARPVTQPSVQVPKVSRPAVQQPTQAPNVLRPTSQAPGPAPDVQTVDLTSPEGKKKFDPKATINIMNKVLAQSKSNAPAVFTQTIADMISKVSADVFNEKSKDCKSANTQSNQSSRSAGNRRQNVGTSAVTRAPGGTNKDSGGASHAARSATRTMAPNRAPIPNRTPISPSQSNSRHRLNMNRVLPKSHQTNQAAPMQGSGQQKIPGYKNGVTYHNAQSLPNTANHSRAGTGPNQKSRVGPPLNNATTNTANPRPMLLVQNISNSNTIQNSHVQGPPFNNTVGNQRPGVVTQRPMPGNQRSMPGNQRPMPGNQRPMPGNQRPMPGNQRPVVGNQTQVGVNQRPIGGRIKLVSPRAGTTGRSYTVNRHGVVVSPRSNRPVSASSLRVGQRPNGANSNSKHLSPKRLLYPGSAPSRQAGSGQGRERPSEVDFQHSVRNKAITSTPRPSRSPIQPQQISIGQEGGLKIMSYSSLATGMTVPVQSAPQKRPASLSPTTGNVPRRQEVAKKRKIETVVLSDSD